MPPLRSPGPRPLPSTQHNPTQLPPAPAATGTQGHEVHAAPSPLPWWLLHPRQGQTRTLGSRGIQQAGCPCPRGQEGLAEQSDRTLLLGGHGPTRASRVGGAVGPLFPRATLRVHRCHWRARPRHGRRVCPPPPAAFRQDRRPWSPRLRAAGAPASTCVRAGRSGRVSGTPAAWPSPSPRRHRSGPSEPNFRSGCSATSQVPSRERVERRVPERCRPAGLAPAHHSAARAVAEHARGHAGRAGAEAGRALAPTGRVPGGYAGAWRAAGPGAPG